MHHLACDWPSGLHLYSYFQNVVESSYSFAFYSWEDWEKLIDWQALTGINLGASPFCSGSAAAHPGHLMIRLGLHRAGRNLPQDIRVVRRELVSLC